MHFHSRNGMNYLTLDIENSAIMYAYA